MTAFERCAPASSTPFSTTYRRYGEIHLERLPRMADFCKWTIAYEGAYWSPDTFMAAYDDAQAAATEDVIEERLLRDHDS